MEVKEYSVTFKKEYRSESIGGLIALGCGRDEATRIADATLKLIEDLKEYNGTDLFRQNVGSIEELKVWGIELEKKDGD